MSRDELFPPIEPFRSQQLQVSTLHHLHVAECGRPDGVPILFVHGGPGAGCTDWDRRLFDPQHFRIVLVDQRGAGRSTPLGETRENDITLLADDFEHVRAQLGIPAWHVFGGSWGSTLGLFYAQRHPAACLSLTLRGVWLFRDEDMDWWFRRVRHIQPELWRAFEEHLTPAERADPLESYYQRLHAPDRARALAAAKAWSVFEGACCTLLPNPEFAAAFEQDDTAWAIARLEAHYFRNLRLGPDTLLDGVERLRHLPGYIVHGRYDIVCPIASADALHRRWPEAAYEVVPDAGHSSHEPGILRALVGATERIRTTGRPDYGGAPAQV
jgi:proline iminopeptidase